jgi:hypothetical protein
MRTVGPAAARHRTPFQARAVALGRLTADWPAATLQTAWPPPGGRLSQPSPAALRLAPPGRGRGQQPRPRCAEAPAPGAAARLLSLRSPPAGCGSASPAGGLAGRASFRRPMDICHFPELISFFWDFNSCLAPGKRVSIKLSEFYKPSRLPGARHELTSRPRAMNSGKRQIQDSEVCAEKTETRMGSESRDPATFKKCHC